MKSKIAITWLIGVMTGAGIVIAWQVGDAQRRFVKSWSDLFDD